MGKETPEQTTHFSWYYFDGRLPSSDALYNELERMKEEPGLLIQQKNNHGCRRDSALDFNVIDHQT
jgi:hypothetical protein